jgi:polysaccharide pyruvyl transferase CsaB
VHKKKQGTILIAGYYGFGNTGDEAILSSILAELCKYQEDLGFIVISANPAETTAIFNVRSIFWKDVDALLDAAAESDLIIVGGGGLFQDYWGTPKGIALTPFHWGIPFYTALGMLAMLYQKPFMIYSVGVGPLFSEEGRRLTRWTFELADIATVRDQESKNLLVSLGVAQEKILVTPDPALVLQRDTESAEKILLTSGIDLMAHPLIGVCIRNWREGEEADRWRKALAEALDRFLDMHDAQVVFIPFQISDHPLENDHAAALSVVAMMQNNDRVYTLDQSPAPATVAGLISYCKMIVGMRLHSLIFAAGAEIPPVALAYDLKVQSLMKDLELSEYSIDLPFMTSEQLFGILTASWERQKQTHETLRFYADRLRELSIQSPQLALRLLEKSSNTPHMEIMRDMVIQQARELGEKEQQLRALSSRIETISTQLVVEQQQLQALLPRIEIISAQLVAKDQELQLTQLQLVAKDQELQLTQLQLGEKQFELNEILISKSWRLVQALRGLRLSFLPPGSRRAKLTGNLYRLSHGLSYRHSRAASLIRQSINRHGLPLAILKGFRILSIRLYHANKRILHRNRYSRELKQLDRLISQHTGFFDLFHVPMGWNTILFQRFQHISLQAAKLGGLALYGGHPIVDRGITVYQKIADNLYVFDATNRQIVDRIFQAFEKNHQPRILRIQSIDLVTTEEDVNRFLQNGFTVIYEYIDEINPAITGNVPDSVYQRHSAILKDERVIVVATSDQLFEEVQGFRSNNFILSTNGVDLEHWRIAKGTPPEDLKPALNGNLVVGYHGALAKWIDYGLLRMIADDGSYELVLIGHEHDAAFSESGLKDHPRVHFLGSKTYFELNNYAVYYDIAILPFKKTELTQAVSPVKIFEYMATRKPVVTTDLRECKKYQSCLVAGTSMEFMEQLNRASKLRNDPSYLGLLDKEAAENSWENKILEILRLAGVKL